jgi:hypothetical protein
MKSLAILCEGLKSDDGDDLLDIKKAPFCSMRRGDIKPSVDMMRAEVFRRFSLEKS